MTNKFIEKIKAVFLSNMNFVQESIKGHGPYALKFFFCEFLCLVNVIGQMYFTDKFVSLSKSLIIFFNVASRFLGYTFMTYGSDVFAMTFGDPEGRSDPMNMVFPKVMMVMMVLMMFWLSGTIMMIMNINKCS